MIIYKEDITANKSNFKSLLFVVCFRISHFFTRNKWLKIIGIPWRIFYKILSEWIYHCELKDFTPVGPGLQIFHFGHSSVIGTTAIIGKNFGLRHNVTITAGGKTNGPNGDKIIIGDNVFIGPSCVVLGSITVGDNAIIAPGSVVVKDVEPNAVVGGNPAKFIKWNKD
jgi:serine acetyltransferase